MAPHQNSPHPAPAGFTEQLYRNTHTNTSTIQVKGITTDRSPNAPSPSIKLDYRSSSPATILSEPITATKSASMCPSSILGISE